MGAAVERAVVEGEGEAAGLEDGGSVGVGAAVLAHRRSPASYESLQTGQLDVIAMILLRLLYGLCDCSLLNVLGQAFGVLLLSLHCSIVSLLP